MKKSLYKIIGSIAICGFIFLNIDNIYASQENTWVKENNIWKYYSNSKAVTGWQKIAQDWYYFNADASLYSGWYRNQANEWYFLNTLKGSDEGKLLKSWQWIDGYCYFFEDRDETKLGKMYNGTKLGNYYINSDGKWSDEKGNAYYISGKGIITNKIIKNTSDILKTAKSSSMGGGGRISSGGGGGASGGRVSLGRGGGVLGGHSSLGGEVSPSEGRNSNIVTDIIDKPLNAPVLSQNIEKENKGIADNSQTEKDTAKETENKGTANNSQTGKDTAKETENKGTVDNSQTGKDTAKETENKGTANNSQVGKDTAKETENKGTANNSQTGKDVAKETENKGTADNSQTGKENTKEVDNTETEKQNTNETGNVSNSDKTENGKENSDVNEDKHDPETPSTDDEKIETEAEFKNIKKIDLYKIENNNLNLLNSLPDSTQGLLAKIYLNGNIELFADVKSIDRSTGKITLDVAQIKQKREEESYSDDLIYTFAQNDINHIDYSTVKNYRPAYEKAYKNLEILMPLHNREEVVSVANHLDINSDLLNKSIKSVYLLEDKEIISDIEANKNRANKLMIKFSDSKIAFYELSYQEDYNTFPMYNLVVDGATIKYTDLHFNAEAGNIISKVHNDFMANSIVDDKDIIAQLGDIKIRAADILLRRVAIANERYPNFKKLPEEERVKILKSITDEEVKKYLISPQYNKLSINNSFKYTVDNVDMSLKTLVDYEYPNISGNSDLQEYIKNKLKSNRTKILLALTYIDRLYDINFENINIGNILKYRSDFYNDKVNNIEFLSTVGDLKYDDISFGNSPKTFKNKFNNQNKANIGNFANIYEFLEYNKNLFDNRSMDEWFKNSTKALVYEVPSTRNLASNYRLYSKIKADRSLEKYLLGILSLKNKSIYIVSNMSTITFGNMSTLLNFKADNVEEKIEEAKPYIDKLAKGQGAWLDTIYMIAKDELKSKLNTSRVVLDTLASYSEDSRKSPKERWNEARDDANPSVSVEDFYRPYGMEIEMVLADGEAADPGFRYFMTSAASDRGLNTYTHEMTHILDGGLILGGYGLRDGYGKEVYARGIYENSQNPERINNTPYYLNLNFAFDFTGEDRVYNKNSDRFTDIESLKDYIHNTLDVLYILDYAEAKKVLEKGNDVKKLWFKELVQVPDTSRNAGGASYTNDKFEMIDDSKANKLNTVYDLIDNHIAVFRYNYLGITKDAYLKVAPSNGYYGIEMFKPIYGTQENANGGVGDISFRKNAFNLLSKYGYYEGMIPYISNQYKAESQKLTDRYILNKVFKGDYSDINSFNKDLFKERIDKVNDLKSINLTYKGQEISINNFSDIEALMENAINEDLKLIKAGVGRNDYTVYYMANNVNDLKKAIYKAYLNQTDDFNTAIFN